MKHTCPSRLEAFANGYGVENEDTWREDDTCSYCGSLNQDVFMARCAVGDVELTPTDKNYKVYVRNAGGEVFKMTYRKDCKDCTGPDDCTHWVTELRNETKFYFQHLTGTQRTHFVALLNGGTLKLGYPGHFYCLPFFVTR